MTELFTIAYNEEYLLPRMIDFYRERIPDIIINVYDNGSTDRTREIVLEKGCNLHYWDTGGEVRDDLLMEFKNNVWKGSKANWIIVVDVDEWVDLDGPFMDKQWNTTRCLYWKCKGYNMVSDTMGRRFPMEDKICVFSSRMTDINYGPGAHSAIPQGPNVQGPQFEGEWPKLYHMKYTMPIEMVIARYKDNAARLSAFNRQHGLGFHYTFDEETIRKEYAETLLEAEEVGSVTKK